MTSHQPRLQPLHQNKIPPVTQMSQQGDSQESNYTQLGYPANTPRQPNTQANRSVPPVTPRQSGGPFSPPFTLSQGNYSGNFLSTKYDPPVTGHPPMDLNPTT
jgi:hypothetical protein